MKTQVHKTALLGELIAAAFDDAARHSSDPLEVSRLATQEVTRLLRRSRRTSISLRATLAALLAFDAGSLLAPKPHSEHERTLPCRA